MVYFNIRSCPRKKEDLKFKASMGNLQIEKVSSFYRSTLRWNFRIFNRLGAALHEIDVNLSEIGWVLHCPGVRPRQCPLVRRMRRLWSGWLLALRMDGGTLGSCYS